MTSSSLQLLLVSNEESNSHSTTRTVGETGLLGLPPRFSMLHVSSHSPVCQIGTTLVLQEVVRIDGELGGRRRVDSSCSYYLSLLLSLS